MSAADAVLRIIRARGCSGCDSFLDESAGPGVARSLRFTVRAGASRRDGKPVDVLVTIAMAFTLKD
jgi:hypothetical protein